MLNVKCWISLHSRAREDENFLLTYWWNIHGRSIWIDNNTETNCIRQELGITFASLLLWFSIIQPWRMVSSCRSELTLLASSRWPENFNRRLNLLSCPWSCNSHERGHQETNRPGLSIWWNPLFQAPFQKPMNELREWRNACPTSNAGPWGITASWWTSIALIISS